MRTTIRESLPDSLQPFEPALRAVVRDGLTLFQSRFSSLRAGMTIRSERSNIHDCMVEIAKKSFPNDFLLSQNRFILRLGGHQIKLKKFNRSLKTSNYPTQLVFDFLFQKVGDLFPSEPSTNLHLGYIPDDIDLVASPVWITCPDGPLSLAWGCELMPEAGQLASPILPATMPDDPSMKPLVSPKKLPKTGESREA